MAPVSTEAATSDRDAVRLRALEGYGLLHAQGERRDLRALVALAAQVCDVPMATLNLITDTEQHQVASVGFAGGLSPRADSMCDVVLDDGAPVVLADASLDERFRHNPWVTGDAHVRFYATHQLVTPDDVAIGTLCVFDSQPRTIDDDRSAALADLASRVVDVLELELRTRQLADAVRRLRASEDELRRSNAELTRFALQVSHDLRTPLATIVGNHELLAAELEEDASCADHAPRIDTLLSRANRAALRMSGLVEGMLARAVEGGRSAEEPVDLDTLLAQVRSDLNVRLAVGELRVAADLPTVRGDALQLRVLFQNLIENGLKFTRPGERALVEVRAETGGLGWRILVADHGTGFGPGDTDRLLTSLRRGDDVGAVQGSGVGLATCKGIVDAHGGRLTLAETPGGGATVVVDLPA